MTKKKIKKLVKYLVIITIVLGIGILGYIGNYFYNLAIDPNTSKSMIFGEEDEDETSGAINKEAEKWLLEESNYKDEYITSFDKLKLHGYKINNKNTSNKWVIAVHGYTSEGIKMSNVAKEYYNMGYNILIPDLRAHGKSEGDYIGMGWDDRKDIISWIDFIIKEDPNAQIVLHGVSMGASTVLMASGEDLPSNVKSIVADCGYTSVWDQFSYQLKELFNLDAFPFMHVSSIVTKIRAGYWLNEASAIEQVEKSKTPILYIHGDKDDFVPFYMMDELYDNTKSEKEKLVVEGAAHAKSSTVNPDLYWSTIENFINKYVN